MFDTLSPAEWDYRVPRKGHNGAYNSYIDTSANSRTTPRAQFATCIAKFGVGAASEQNPTSTRRNLDLSVADAEMIEFFKQVDKKNCEAAAEISKSTFNKEYSADMLYETIYVKTIKDEDKRYEPLVRTKVVVGGDARNRTNIHVVTATDSETGEFEFEDGSYEDITKYSHVDAIVDFRGLWFASREFGMSIVCKSILVWRGPLNYVSDARLQQVLSYLCPRTIRQFAWVTRKWRRVLKALLKCWLVELDSARWPAIENFDDVSVAELEAMYDGHPMCVSMKN